MRDQSARGNASKEDVTSKAQSVGAHWGIFVLIATNYTQLDMELVLSYMLLAESTVGCDYVTSMAQLRTVQFACMLAWRPISGYLTDATAQIADWVLLAAATLELVTLLALMLLPIIWGRGGYSVWIVLALQLAKAMIEIQVYNSVWKIFKMRLEFRFEIQTGKQCAILSNVGLMAEQAELWYNLVVCGCAAFYIRHLGTAADFRIVQMWFFGATLITTVIMLVTTILIIRDGDYFTVPVTGQRLKSRADSAVNSSIVPLLQAEAVEKGDSRRAVSANPAASVKFSEGLAPSRTQSVGGTRARGGSFALSRARLASQEWDGPREGHVFASTHLVQYVRESASYVYNNTVAWRVCIHALLINIPFAIIGSSLEFAMPGRDTMVPSEKTIENFCGNYITNTVTQDSMINAVYVVAIWAYLFGLRRVSAFRYFQTTNPVLMVLLAGLGTVMAFKLNQMLEYFTLSALLAGLWFLFLYDNFLGTAAVAHKYYGFFSFVIGYVQTVPQVVAYLIMSYHINPTTLLVVSQGVIVAAAAYSMFFGYSSHEELCRAGKGLCNQNKP